MFKHLSYYSLIFSYPRTHGERGNDAAFFCTVTHPLPNSETNNGTHVPFTPCQSLIRSCNIINYSNYYYYFSETNVFDFSRIEKARPYPTLSDTCTCLTSLSAITKVPKLKSLKIKNKRTASNPLLLPTFFLVTASTSCYIMLTYHIPIGL